MFILAMATFALIHSLLIWERCMAFKNSQGTFRKKYVCPEYDLDMIIFTKEIFKSISTGIRKELFLVKDGFVKMLENPSGPSLRALDKLFPIVNC